VDYGKQPVSAGNDTDVETDKHGRKSYVITKQRESWSAEEHERFMEGVEKYGRKWKEVAEHVNTRTPVQIRSHAQKYFIKACAAGNHAASTAASFLRRPFLAAENTFHLSCVPQSTPCLWLWFTSTCNWF
jgi:SHAQKYF class myb-like DNA-binding protein